MAYREPLGWPRLSADSCLAGRAWRKNSKHRVIKEKKSCAQQTIEEITDEGHGNFETDDRWRPGDGDDTRLRCSAHLGLRRLHQARTGQAVVTGTAGLVDAGLRD